MAQHDVEVVGSQSVQAHIDAFCNSLCAEIEMLQIVSAEFRAKQVAVARDIAQGDTKEDFAHAAAVEGRGVDEVQARIQRDAHAP